MAAEYTDSQRVEFFRHVIVAEGYLPREIEAVRRDNRCTAQDFDTALNAAMQRYDIAPAGVGGSIPHDSMEGGKNG